MILDLEEMLARLERDVESLGCSGLKQRLRKADAMARLEMFLVEANKETEDTINSDKTG